MFSFTLTLTVLVAASVTTASPVAHQTCSTSTYAPFMLFARQKGSNEAQIIRLVNAGVDSNNNTISTMTVCETCGDAPAYWQLKDSILSPYWLNTAEGQSTVNMPLVQGKINFVTGDESSIVKSRTYCAVHNSSADTGLPGFLAVDGNTDNFSICSFIGTPGPTHRRDVYFNQTSNRIAYGCQPAHLIMQGCS